MKIRLKILLFVVLPILLIDLAITSFNAYSNYNTLKALSESEFIANTELMASEIATENARGVALSKSTAQAARSLFGNRTATTTLIKNVLEDFPTFTGGSVGYEINADLSDYYSEIGLKNIRDGNKVDDYGGIDSYNFKENKTNVSIDEWIDKSEGGRFIAYWNRKNNELLLEPLVGMKTAMYSAGLRKKVESSDAESFIVTEPYLYNNNTMMVEYSSPIFRDGNFIGQVAFDKDLTSIGNMLKSMKSKNNEQIFLISSEGRIIANTKDDKLRTISVNALNAESLDLATLDVSFNRILKSTYEMSRNSMFVKDYGKSVSYFIDKQTGKSYCISQAFVKPANWIIIDIVPTRDLLSALYYYIYREALGFVGFLITVLVAFVLMSTMISRVVKSTYIAQEITKGNFRIDLESVEASNDETSTLLRSMYRMLTKLRVNTLQLKFTSSELSESSSNLEKWSGKYDRNLESFNEELTNMFKSIANLVSISDKISLKADSLSDDMLSNARLANDSKLRIVEIDNTISDLSLNTNAVARRFSIISERTANITSIVKAIAKLAEDTNLLSLNASIESEKAGVYGLGFAVVAKEIGRLSEQIFIVEEDIENVLKDISSAIDSGNSEMDSLSDKINIGKKEISDMVNDLSKLIQNTQSILPKTETLSTEMLLHKNDISKINDSISTIDGSLKQSLIIKKDIKDVKMQLKEYIEKFSVEISNLYVDNQDNK